MLPRPLRLSLYAVFAVASAVLVRSVIYDRWVTVIAALLLLAGAVAAQRGKTWGIGLALAAAMSFPAAVMLGMGPAWFCFVGLVGALPFVVTSKAIARFDTTATAVFALFATAFGVASALVWRAVAPTVFALLPMLRPGHSVSTASLGALTIAISLLAIAWRSSSSSEPVAVARVRVVPAQVDDEPLRAEHHADAEEEFDDAAPASTRHLRA